mmetsp:Transcript_38295/g.89410  ORF Transcript_38295/g.89410 Transcript_38295/m.89410 type:complete len:155 (-) Transcript_38295:46-510(-)
MWAQARAESKMGREAIAASAMRNKLMRWNRVAQANAINTQDVGFDSDVSPSQKLPSTRSFSTSPEDSPVSASGGRKSPTRLGGRATQDGAMNRSASPVGKSKASSLDGARGLSLSPTRKSMDGRPPQLKSPLVRAQKEKGSPPVLPSLAAKHLS